MSPIMDSQVDKVNKKDPAGSEDIFDALHALMHLYRARQMRAWSEGPLALTHLEAKTLGFFARHPGATLTELVSHSGRDKGQLARLVASLRERGLLEARVSDADRRVQQLFPSEAALEQHRQLRQLGRQLARRAMQGIPASELTALAGTLARIRANLAASD
jgi:DNA-binding MarR family transcriptional regulator